jgi:uncharacterized protein YecT (DUF1311 family)
VISRHVWINAHPQPLRLETDQMLRHLHGEGEKSVTSPIRIALTIALLALCSAPTALAQPGHAPNCADPFFQAEINMCAKAEHEAAEKEMDGVLAQVIAQYAEQDRDYADLGPEYVGAEKLFAASQASWVVSRKDFCGARGLTNYGGSMRPAVVSACFAMMARSRTEELRWLLE